MQGHPRRHFLKLLAGLAVFAAARETRAADEKHVAIRFAGGKVVGASVIRLTQGETVRFEWQSDTAMDIHLHGYDVELALQPGMPVTTTFKAHASGRFPLTSHGAGHGHAALLYIEVHPD